MAFVALERGGTPLTRQIYDQLRTMILTGVLAAGARMISTRGLAAELGVSRNIVLDAFDQLMAEGFLEARTGAGTFVASGASFQPRDLPGFPRQFRLSAFGRFTRTRSTFARVCRTLRSFPSGRGTA